MIANEPFDLSNAEKIYTVSRLNGAVRTVLESAFPTVWVEGEISNYIHHRSGHCYFSLKDETAQVRCAFFRGRNRLIGFMPENGMHVLVRAQMSLYEARGDYQLIIEYMEEAGEGALRRAFDQLKNKLEKQGLFALSHKKPLPILPKCIGVITSPTGAAIHDVLNILNRRFPTLPVIIYPTAVQGATASAQIIRAIETANQRRECDVLILTRGGGSLEDLWCFNDETLAHIIFNSEIPIVSAVGHEVDFTLADFVADHRAPTPSAAAELVSPHQQHWMETFVLMEKNLIKTLQQYMTTQQQAITSLRKQLRHPGQVLQTKMQMMDYLEQQLLRAWNLYVDHNQKQLTQMGHHLQSHCPRFKLEAYQTQLLHLKRRGILAIKQLISMRTQGLCATVRALDTLSPLRTLERGYAILKKDKSEAVIRDPAQVILGELIRAQVAKGVIGCRVETIRDKI